MHQPSQAWLCSEEALGPPAPAPRTVPLLCPAQFVPTAWISCWLLCAPASSPLVRGLHRTHPDAGGLKSACQEERPPLQWAPHHHFPPLPMELPALCLVPRSPRLLLMAALRAGPSPLVLSSCSQMPERLGICACHIDLPLQVVEVEDLLGFESMD